MIGLSDGEVDLIKKLDLPAYEMHFESGSTFSLLPKSKSELLRYCCW